MHQAEYHRCRHFCPECIIFSTHQDKVEFQAFVQTRIYIFFTKPHCKLQVPASELGGMGVGTGVGTFWYGFGTVFVV